MKAPALAVMFGHQSDDDEDEPPADDHDQACDDAIDEMMSALKSSDKSKFREALDAYLDLRSAPPADDEEEEDDDSGKPKLAKMMGA